MPAKQKKDHNLINLVSKTKRRQVSLAVHCNGPMSRRLFYLRADLGTMVQSELSWTERLTVADADALCDVLARAFDYDVPHPAPTGRLYGHFASPNVFQLSLYSTGRGMHRRRLGLTLSRTSARKLLTWLAPRVDWELEK